MKSPQEQLEILTQGVAQFVSREELLKKLEERRPLRVKLGFDPSSPDIHLGHALTLRKVRQFQDLGHLAVIIIGDYTAMIGDPTGRSKTRPALSQEEIHKNAETYQEQIFKIIDRSRCEVRRNSEWFGAFSYADVLKLNSQMTVARMLERDDFKKRYHDNISITLTEFQYPLMQGYDSVRVQADVELGGTDQLFNNLVGRDLQRDAGQVGQVVMVMPILEGLDGVQKMSKSLNNYIGISESPDQMFGKVMSICDELMQRWYPLVLGVPYPTDEHPMKAKKHLSCEVIKQFHTASAADKAREEFEVRFSKRDNEQAHWPEIKVETGVLTAIELVERAYLDAFQIKKSRGEIRTLIQQGSIQIEGAKLSDPSVKPEFKINQVLKLDKTRSVKLVS